MVFARSSLRLARPATSLLSQRATPALAQRGASVAKSLGGVRTLTATSSQQGKVLLVLYDVSLSFQCCLAVLFLIALSRATSTPSRSQGFWEPLRTSLVSGNGSRIRATLLSPLLTRRVPTASSTRSLLTPRSSLPHRRFGLVPHCKIQAN